MTPLLAALLQAIGSVLLSLSDTIYDIVIFPGGKMIYGTLKHVPFLGPSTIKMFDHILERLSKD